MKSEVTKKEETKIETPIVSIPANITTVSGKIRYLLGTGMKRGAVAKQLGKRYQHVRNVELTPLKKVSA